MAQSTFVVNEGPLNDESIYVKPVHSICEICGSKFDTGYVFHEFTLEYYNKTVERKYCDEHKCSNCGRAKHEKRDYCYNCYRYKNPESCCQYEKFCVRTCMTNTYACIRHLCSTSGCRLARLPGYQTCDIHTSDYNQASDDEV